MEQIKTTEYLQKLDVCLFEQFQIRMGEKVLTETSIRSYMVVKLLIYMICHRNTPITVHELTDVLWGGENCENPVGALKNLMYRLRMILKKQLGDYPFVLTNRGFYQWNTQIHIKLDIEEFEKMCRLSQTEKEDEKRIEMELKAERTYQAKLLDQYSEDYWFLSTREYYHSLYLNLAKRLAEDLEQKNRFSEMEKICHSAIQKDGIDEDLHYYLIRSYLNQNKPKLAFDDYKKTSQMLYESLGVGPSGRLSKVYEQMMKQQHESDPDLARIHKRIQQELNTNVAERPTGAFFCEYGVFMKNYELEIRRAQRQRRAVYLGLLTIQPSIQYKMDSQAYTSTVLQGVKQLETVLLSCLRAGDVVSRYSEAQYILMLPACEYQDAIKVMNRINRRFDDIKQKAKVHVTYSLDQMEAK